MIGKLVARGIELFPVRVNLIKSTTERGWGFARHSLEIVAFFFLETTALFASAL